MPVHIHGTEVDDTFLKFIDNNRIWTHEIGVSEAEKQLCVGGVKRQVA
jgi:hypothetical protein